MEVRIALEDSFYINLALLGPRTDGIGENEMKCNIVTVRWFDGYLEEFRATEVRFGSDLLFMRLEDGKNRQIPLRGVRWFGMSEESHQSENKE